MLRNEFFPLPDRARISAGVLDGFDQSFQRVQLVSGRGAGGWAGGHRWAHAQKAVELLAETLQQRPGNVKVGPRLAWALIEIRRYADALQTIESAAYQQQAGPERAMARAVARWQAQEHDQALLDFNVAIGMQPEWGNSSWVKALYSPLVAQSIQEMQTERERRKHKARSLASR